MVIAGQTADNQDANRRWQALQFLFGKWTGTGGGQPGSGQGVFSFQPEVNNRIVVRRNSNAIDSGPAAGSSHDDLLIIYLEAADDKPKAIYFDSEGHVIRYKLTIPHPNSVVFESDGSQPGPGYRLSYVLEGKNLNGKFEMAGSNKMEYKTYLSWTATKDWR